MFCNCRGKPRSGDVAEIVCFAIVGADAPSVAAIEHDRSVVGERHSVVIRGSPSRSLLPRGSFASSPTGPDVWAFN